ncbi:LpqB family beta-propeller domain-containing protein [Actinoallomurus bryophytorum]|uniref:Sporulation and spore germination protein n=1 Tax=Actinoallomurus bryophytorum TaxID=1490222 RepID=A0A543CMS3_9ACTN|nr:LpqB family beta-propeller domain-containing protein [Actinoallomurus bryophytorum]TQL98379.1 sporulation and spore germination protein [Actinoallomurus bryophytorum]
MRSLHRPVFAGALGAVLLAGCASVPSGSQVVGGRVTGHQQPIDDPYVRVIPVGPGRDWDPGTMVTAFQAASGSFDGPNGEHQVAREYLACGGCWRPGVNTVVYDSVEQSAVQRDGDRATVTDKVVQLGRIGTDGQYIADPHNFDQTYQLRQDAQKQWRITDLPQELLLSRNDVNRAFRTLNLYFFAPETPVLVPNPVFIPLVNRNWLSEQLVKQLLGGPTSWLRGAAVRTGFPSGTQLRRLDITGGVATVDLSRQARAGNLRNMSIQLMWTLRQLREVDQLKLEIDGKAIRVPGLNSTVQSSGAWSSFDPNGTSELPRSYVRTADGRLARLDTVPQPQVLLPKLRVSHPAVSYDARQVAALNTSGGTVTVTDLSDGTSRAVLKAKLKDGRFSTPSWDTRGNVWAVESNSKESRLWEIAGGTKKVSIDNWTLAPHPVKALRISRDGTRAAAIVQMGKVAEVQLGRVDRAPSGGLQAEGFIAISSEEGAIDLAWRDADHLAVVGVTPGNPSPVLYDVPVSGAAIQPLVGPGGDMKAVAAYPGAPLLVTQHVSNPQSSDNVCRLSDKYDEWKCFYRTSDPAYPG